MRNLFVRMLIKKFLPAALICFGLGWVFPLSPEEQPARAPRTDACTTCVVTCPSSVELDEIRACVCSINSNMTEDFQGTWTAIAQLQECCEELLTTFTTCCGGADGDAFCDDLNTIPLINAKEASIGSWLKTLYALNRGLCGFQTP